MYYIFQASVSTYTLAKAIGESDFYQVTSNRTSNINEYDYDVKKIGIYTNVDGNQVAMFHVKEYYKLALTQGGATFKVTVRGSHTKSSCSYRDLFTGSYVICCVLHEYQNVVWITLKNVNFLAYRLYYSHNRILGKFTIEGEHPSVDTYGRIIEDDQFNSHSEKVYNVRTCYRDRDYWLRNADHDWRYVKDNKLLTHLSRDQVNNCIDNKYNGQLIVNGDSHARFEYFFINTEIRGHPKTRDYQVIKEKTDFLVMIRNSSFHMSTYKHVFLKHLKWLYINHPQSILRMRGSDDYSSYILQEKYPDDLQTNDHRKALLMLDSGTWDLAFNNSALYISNFYAIKSVLNDLKEQNKYEMIWQSIPPWAHAMEHNGYRHTNTFMNGAVNSWVAEQLKDVQIPMLNIWKMALPFQDSSVSPCGCHYLCQSEGQWVGYPGAEAAYDFLLTACS